MPGIGAKPQATMKHTPLIHFHARRLLATCLLAGWLQAGTAAPLVLDLPSQDLATSLRTLAQRAGLTLQTAPGVDLGARAPALQGSYELDQALVALLADTGLAASVSAGVLRIAPAPATPQAQRVDIVGARLGVDVAERVQRAQAAEVRDLFAAEASADVGGGTRNGQRLYLRGVEASQLNVTIDGARQGANLYNHRGGLPNIEPELVKRIELKPGPPAADDGYGALGGSVRFETIDAQDRLADGQRLGGLAKLGAASVNELSRGGLGLFTRLGGAAPGQGGDIGLLAYASAADYDDLRIGGGDRIPFSGGRDRAALLKLSALQLGAHSLRVGVEQHEARGFNYMQRGDYPYQVQPPFATRPPQDQTLTRTAGTLRWDYDPGLPWLRLRASAAQTRSDFYAPNSNAERFISRVRNLELRNELQYDLGSVLNRTTLGIDRYSDDGSSEFLNRPTATMQTENTGLFVQSRFAGAAWGVEAGVRRDRWRTHFRVRTAEGSATSMNLQGDLNLGAGFGVFGGVGESARGYSTIPLQFIRNIGSTLLFNGSADAGLRTETARLAEAGLRWRGAGLALPGDRATLEFKAYDNRVRDSILYRQPGSGGLGGRPVTEFFNYAETARFHGWEARADWSAGTWATQLTVARPRVANLPPDPQFIARFGAPTGGKLVWDARWQALPSLLLGYTLTGVRGNSDVPSNQVVFIPRAGYALHDVQLVWKPELPQGSALPGAFSLALAVNNLGDRRYSSQVTFTERGFSTEEPGRNVRLTASLAW